MVPVYFILGGRSETSELVQCFLLQSASEGCEVLSDLINQTRWILGWKPWKNTHMPREVIFHLLNYQSCPWVISTAGVRLGGWGSLLTVIIVITIQNTFRGSPYHLWSLKSSELLPYKEQNSTWVFFTGSRQYFILENPASKCTWIQ